MTIKEAHDLWEKKESPQSYSEEMWKIIELSREVQFKILEEQIKREWEYRTMKVEVLTEELNMLYD